MNILFICTHNRCRSILSEAIMLDVIKKHENSSLQVKSAGSNPAGQVHPLTLEHLKRRGYDTQNLNSISWDDLENFVPDVCITVCDKAANEACPLYLGHAIKVHWGLSDPSKANMGEDKRQQAFDAIIDILGKRIERVCQTDFSVLTDVQIKKTFDEIGEIK